MSLALSVLLMPTTMVCSSCEGLGMTRMFRYPQILAGLVCRGYCEHSGLRDGGDDDSSDCKVRDRFRVIELGAIDRMGVYR